MFILDALIKLGFFLYFVPIIIFIAFLFVFVFWKFILIWAAFVIVAVLFQLHNEKRKAQLRDLEWKAKLEKETQRSLLAQQKMESYRQAQLKKEPEPLLKATGTATFIPAAGGEEQKINISITIK
ncbi:hypothetical protein [Testudinibacter sp. TR-2022]|uniref:hypothetical protein n=1 Tax=Testudinibacter sp. TR-2022 TaxID=2585029 RepID=UPI001119EE89|nr:hypothetical protein [Testudinibacter sp. TR-2022]TNH06326.1 hypothetical protein FHQ30_08565 [Pasteurellaceae bacterium Phil11]TNH22876.1 hypothetical protein FHQ27_12075 [Testudinibacter sp. TR-2022]TNH23877.1 hypothetical protein FHQ29_04640 [Testudinibacter sp. TR-2022]